MSECVTRAGLRTASTTPQSQSAAMRRQPIVHDADAGAAARARTLTSGRGALSSVAGSRPARCPRRR
eukprot:2194697-Prymnesium_polylepis.1